MLLNCHTYYSFCYGTFSVERLLNEVQSKGYNEFVLTDINNTSACLETIRLAKEKSLKALAGIDFRNNAQQQYVGIARNNEGFRELNEHLSRHLHEGIPFDPVAPEFNHAYIVYPQSAYKGWALRDHEFIGIDIKDLVQWPFLRARNQPGKVVALHTVSFGGQLHYNAHRLLRAIDANTLLSKLGREQQALGSEIMLPKDELYAAYRAFPFIIDNTERLLKNCSIDFTYGKLTNKNKKHFRPEGENDMEFLKQECEKNLQYRYPDLSDEVKARVEKELAVIEKMQFASYFLINWDIVRYAREKNYYYVGRGSGANSIIAYLLRITDVDPIELDLYFERFINENRTNAPDFDIDFSWTDRDDITRYIFDTYGYEHTALLGAYSTFQHDAITRELGKVFGLPPGEIDRLQGDVRSGVKLDKIGQLVKKYSEVLKGFPSHLSIHSSGIIISEEPVTCYSATSMPPKGYPTTQFSMLEAEDIGLYKFDILSQRGLGKIRDSLDIIQKNTGTEIDIHEVARFKQDEKIKDLLRVGKTIGCFYVESPAMRMLLAKLEADDYLRLVAASSIIRPGVAKSGMMREYILRYQNKARRDEARDKLPELYELLKETYGVMVYQEDVIKVAHFFAGLTLAEADSLRRGMSWKFKQRHEFFTVKDKFFSNCREKGYKETLIADIWYQIETFANFAFSKGHSASYAVESYQALYLKAHYPLEYMVATLNNGGGFYRKELYLHEARLHGATIVPPCLNTSDEFCNIQGTTIYLGLSMISELQEESVKAILRERRSKGQFRDMFDFVKRVPLSIEQMRLLIRANAFSFTGRNKKELLWEIHSLLQPKQTKTKVNELFETKPSQWKLPELTASAIDEAFDEIELFGFSFCSPFHLLRDELPSKLTAAVLKHYLNKTVVIVGYMITVKHTSTSKGEHMYFGTFIDIKGQWIDTVHFPPSARQYPFTGPGCYELRGKVTEEFNFRTIEIDYMKRLPVIDRERMHRVTEVHKIGS